MEENTDGTRKITPSIPANYISIRHLQERWINEKDRKRKEEEEKRRKQQVEEHQRIEDDLKKMEEARGQRDEEKRLDRSNRKHWGRNSRKKESMNGGDVKFAEEEEPEVTAAIVSERGEDAAAPEKNRGFRRKRYKSKKKKNQDVAVVEDVVVNSGCGSIAPPEFVVKEKITPVKDVIEVYRKKGEKTTGKKSVEYREKSQDVAVVEDVVVDSGCGSITPPEIVVTKKITPVKDVTGVYRKKRAKATGKKSVEYREKNQDVAVVEDVVVDSDCGSITPPEVVVTEKITPVKDVTGVYRKKRVKATGKKSVEYREKNQDVAVVEDVVVDSDCGSITPPEVVVTEKITPVKDVTGVYRKKRKATGKKCVEYREKAVTDDATAIETQFEDLSIKKGETKNLKAQTRSSNRNRNDLVHQRVRMPIGAAAASTMVWVKKEQNERAGDGIASGVKPLNA